MNMYEYHPLIKSPTNHTKIWQYMDLSCIIIDKYKSKNM